MIGVVALFQQVAVALHRILQGCGIGVLRGKPIGKAQHSYAAMHRQSRAEALGVI